MHFINNFITCICLLTSWLNYKLKCTINICFSLTPESHRNMFNPFQPAPELGPYRAMGIECILSTFYYFVILGVTDPDRGLECTVPGFPIGAVISIDIMAAVSFHWKLTLSNYLKKWNLWNTYIENVHKWLIVLFT